ncbi:hypothetical protein LSM04_001247 [Trypanosoma melophagium]|uniref:uncharacterized protein n=1 Tax=Trypanosoma melophagium TaxID=715481 RepID=UPI00351A0FA7|nr:hypothetical protein LSM04_001247 [Trypanosoma melophagium]
MARRQRVPRHKEHRRKRNKNPKLSPFQREQQRAKLANQPPIASIKGSQRDYPVSQRGVIQYLMAKRERQMEKKRLREEAAAAEEMEKEERETKMEFTENDVESNTALDTDNVSCGSSPTSDSPLHEEEEDEKEIPKKKKKESLIKKKKHREDKINSDESLVPPSVSKKSKKDRTVQSKITKTAQKPAREVITLNEQFAAALAPPIAAFRTHADSQNAGVWQQEKSAQVVIAKKKEKKHRKKVEARRERVRQMLLETEKQLQDELLLTKTGKKRRREKSVDAKDAAFERKLIQMQKEKAAREALEKREAAKVKQKEEENGTSSKRANRRKRISFADNDDKDNGADAPHRAMRYPNDKGTRKPSEFYELVDVVRYGERVEAPPVFDAVPRHDASITRLAQRLEYATKSTSNQKGSISNINSTNVGPSSSKAERLKLLSSVGEIGEQKRLERLGLTPLATAGINNTTGRSVKLSKEEEMRRLREGVMEAYRRHRRAEVVSRKGVDMQHQFPLFS